MSFQSSSESSNGLSLDFLFDLEDRPSFARVLECVLEMLKELLERLERLELVDMRSGDIERTLDCSLTTSKKDFDTTPG